MSRVLTKFLFRIFISVLIYSTTADEFADGVFIIKMDYSEYHVLLLIVYELSQAIFSPIQAAISDLYCRKSVLVFTIASTIIGCIAFKLFSSYSIMLQFLIVGLIGMLANTLPIAWGAIADNVPSEKFRPYFAWSICFYAIGNALTFYIIPTMSFNGFFALTIILLCISLSGAICYFDVRDYDPHDERKVLHAKTQNIKNPLVKVMLSIKVAIWDLIRFFKVFKIRTGILIFTLSEIAFFQIFLRIELLSAFESSIPIALTSGLGYVVGTMLLTFSKSSDAKLTFFGLFSAMIFLSLAFICLILGFSNRIMLILLYGCYSLSLAFFTPSIFSLIRPKGSPHHGGKLFGLMDSGESFAKVICTLGILGTQSYGLGKVVFISVIILCASTLLMKKTIFNVKTRT